MPSLHQATLSLDQLIMECSPPWREFHQTSKDLFHRESARQGRHKEMSSQFHEVFPRSSTVSYELCSLMTDTLAWIPVFLLPHGYHAYISHNPQTPFTALPPSWLAWKTECSDAYLSFIWHFHCRVSISSTSLCIRRSTILLISSAFIVSSTRQHAHRSCLAP